jgi:hypothetical protein
VLLKDPLGMGRRVLIPHHRRLVAPGFVHHEEVRPGLKYPPHLGAAIDIEQFLMRPDQRDGKA